MSIRYQPKKKVAKVTINIELFGNASDSSRRLRNNFRKPDIV